MSFLGRNSALTTLLDSTAPFNVIIIPNTTLGRYIFPHHAGRAMSNLVKSYFFQFLFEDLP
jgi:electron transfer flavoprotein alpha subunit